MTNELILVSELEFDSPINRDNGYTNQRLAEKAHSVMRMYKMEYGYQIEWEIPALDEVTHMNLYLSDVVVTDYDGVFELPNEVKGWLKTLGIEFDDDLFEEED